MVTFLWSHIKAHQNITREEYKNCLERIDQLLRSTWKCKLLLSQQRQLGNKLSCDTTKAHLMQFYTGNMLLDLFLTIEQIFSHICAGFTVIRGDMIVLLLGLHCFQNEGSSNTHRCADDNTTTFKCNNWNHNHLLRKLENVPMFCPYGTNNEPFWISRSFQYKRHWGAGSSRGSSYGEGNMIVSTIRAGHNFQGRTLHK